MTGNTNSPALLSCNSNNDIHYNAPSYSIQVIFIVKLVFKYHTRESQNIVPKYTWYLNTSKIYMECNTVVIEKNSL
jgi:hypothetical protein